MTIDDLAERLSLSRSTIYYWVRDLPIPAATENRSAAQRRGTLAMQRRYTLRRDPEFRDFVCLYIAEGYKRNRGVVSLNNSDPAVIKVADRWIKRFATNPITYQVQFHADQRLSELATFWSGQLAVEPAAIRFQRKSNSGQLSGRTWRCRYGVLTVCANDTTVSSAPPRMDRHPARLVELDCARYGA